LTILPSVLGTSRINSLPCFTIQPILPCVSLSQTAESPLHSLNKHSFKNQKELLPTSECSSQPSPADPLQGRGLPACQTCGLCVGTKAPWGSTNVPIHPQTPEGQGY
jgi:hypothetical protein